MVQYLGCKHQEITTCTELCRQDCNRDKEIRSCHPLLRQLKRLRVEQILYPRDAVMAYKCINGLAPSYLLNNIVTGTRKFDHVTPLLRQLKWLRVEQILYPRDAVMAYKCINGLAPSYLLNNIVTGTRKFDHVTHSYVNSSGYV